MCIRDRGVENQRQIVELQAFDCSHAQGFLFSKPMNREQVGKLLTERQQWLTEGGIIVEDPELVGKR